MSAGVHEATHPNCAKNCVRSVQRDLDSTRGWNGSTHYNQLWVLDVQDRQWSQLWTGEGTISLGNPGLAVDTAGTALYRFGGYERIAGQYMNVLERFDLSSGDMWEVLDVSGELPEPRRFNLGGKGLFYDVARDRLVMLGGRGSSGAWLGDVWTIYLP